MCGRKNPIACEEIIKSVENLGFKDAAEKYNLSVSTLKGRYYLCVSRLTNATANTIIDT